MVLARVAEYFSSSQAPQTSHDYLDNSRDVSSVHSPQSLRRSKESLHQDTPPLGSAPRARDLDHEAYRPPYLHAMVAGGFGGTTGDMLMHSLDTVKTRQQGDMHMPPKYTTMGNTYYTIFRQEGVWRGLYGGVTPAFLGSFFGTTIFFSCYEWSKRAMLDHGVPSWAAYLAAGFVADLAASPLYVPSEVLKTRLQLQGRYNNPFFTSGYNYRSTGHALRTIYRMEGLTELFSGYKATLFRDLPFSALQFAFYEQEQKWAKQWIGPGREIGMPLEILTGSTAGGMAGVLTCPMDVVKTRIQTELDPDLAAASKEKKSAASTVPSRPHSAGSKASPGSTQQRPSPSSSKSSDPSRLQGQQRKISTSGASTSLKHHGQASLDTESVFKALRIIYQTEGFSGWFRGVGPRFVWTSVQSGTMLVVYQKLLRWFELNPLVQVEAEEGLRGWG